MAKPKHKKIPWPLLGLIYGSLLFALYVSLSTLVLGFFGQSTIGTVDSYDSRLENRNTGENRSRTVSKGYYFTVSGKTYRGYVTYFSDETWPRLSKGQTRTERISYLPVLPYINKPSALVEFDEMGELAIVYHALAPFGYLFLLFLVTGTVKRQRKKSQSMSSQHTETPAAISKIDDIFCTECGTRLPGDAQFCSACGASINAPEPTSVTQATASSFPSTTPTPGFSNYCDHPEILEVARKNRKSSMGCMWVMTLVPLIGFIIAGLLIDEYPLADAVVIGGGIAVLMLVVNLVALRRAKKPVWEGVVVDKTSKERSKRESKEDSSYTTCTEYTTVIRTQDGKKKTIVEIDSRRDMYDYLTIGDRVRFHPAFGTYEKYDKSKDRIIYCNVCSMENPIHKERCKRCNNLLFK